MSKINEMYALMQKNSNIAKSKGSIGEEILLQILKDYRQTQPEARIIHSYSYKLQSDRDSKTYPGNIKKIGGSFCEVTGENLIDEIDLVLITPYRIFAIEAKARTGTWKIYDHWVKQNGTESEKSPITQTEKHARHLYHLLHEYLPDGKPEYIVPLTVFVDKAKILDERNPSMKLYVQVAIANTLKQKIKSNNVPLQFKLDTDKISEFLKRNGNGTFY